MVMELEGANKSKACSVWTPPPIEDPSEGTKGYQNIGVAEHRGIGLCRNTGVFRNIGVSEHKSVGTQGYRNMSEHTVVGT